jgi:hypothetical protein
MKRLFTLLTFISVLNTFVLAQTKIEVRPVLEAYSQEMINGNWSKSLDYTYPGLYEIVPRAQMEQVIVTTFQDTSVFVIGFSGMEFGKVSEVFEDTDYNYSFVDYTMQMTMRLTEQVTADQYPQMVNAMKAQFGQDNVMLKEKTIFIDQQNIMAAIKTKTEQKIYFLEMKPELFPMMTQFMSSSFIENARKVIE